MERSYTESLCPACLKRLPAQRVAVDGEIRLVKTCPEHGEFSATIWRGPPAFEHWQRPKVPVRPPGISTDTEDGCPFDCGLCPVCYAGAPSRVPDPSLDAWVKARIDLPAGRELTRSALTAYQLEKLVSVLDYVKRCSPFYRQQFADYDPRSITCLEDLSGWPMTTSDDLRSDPLALLCISQSRVQRVVTLPTRSEDERPRRLFFSPADLELAVDFFHHGFSTQVAPGQRMLILMPCRKPHSVGDLLSRGLARLGVKPVPYGPMQDPEAVVDAVLDHSIDCLVGVPAEMEMLARHPGIKRIPGGRIRSVWLGTQNSLQCDVAEIGRRWGCPVFQHYGAAVMCPGGGVECAAREGFHLREADVIIEIVNPRTNRPAVDGTRGEVVVTTLTREAMPLVRYRTGHLAAFVAAPCQCGSELRRITALRGETF